jgi:hypothetical protein
VVLHGLVDWWAGGLVVGLVDLRTAQAERQVTMPTVVNSRVDDAAVSFLQRIVLGCADAAIAAEAIERLQASDSGFRFRFCL